MDGKHPYRHDPHQQQRLHTPPDQRQKRMPWCRSGLGADVVVNDAIIKANKYSAGSVDYDRGFIVGSGECPDRLDVLEERQRDELGLVCGGAS
jgi:hypothetical protein